MRCLISSAGLGLALCATTADAQSSALDRGDRFVTTSFGASFTTSNGPHFALIRDRKVWQSGFQAEWVLASNRRMAISSTVELVGAMVLRRRDAPLTECFWRVSKQTQECYPVAGPKTPVLAIGATPLGFKVYVAPWSPVRLFGSVGGGFIAFDRNTPIVAARAANFAAEYLVGVELGRKGGSAVSAAWKFQHWSNGGTARANPGVDANLFYLSIKRTRR